MEEKLKIYIIKTDKCWFVKEDTTNSWDIEQIGHYYFNNNQPKKTFSKGWYQIDIPENNELIIEVEVKGEEYNERYEIKDKEYISNKLPEIIKIEDKEKYYDEYYESYKILDEFYDYKYDTKEPYKKILEYDMKILFEIDNFKFPEKFEFEGIRRWNFNEEPYIINRDSIEHQELDKIIFPDLLLINRPCSLSSKQMYDITRQYIKNNIDNNIAKITSDYDFCFKVKKIVKLLVPEKITYKNLFGRTKKEREKTICSINEYKEVEIFEMTHDQEKYKGYTSIEPMYANNEYELKQKIDTWLKELIIQINKPLVQCQHCNGTGYEGAITKIDKNKR